MHTMMRQRSTPVWKRRIRIQIRVHRCHWPRAALLHLLTELHQLHVLNWNWHLHLLHV